MKSINPAPGTYSDRRGCVCIITQEFSVECDVISVGPAQVATDVEDEDGNKLTTLLAEGEMAVETPKDGLLFLLPLSQD